MKMFSLFSSRRNFIQNLILGLTVSAFTFVLIEPTTLHAKESVIREFYSILSAPDLQEKQKSVTLKISSLVTELWETTPPLITTLPTATPRTAFIKQVQDTHQNIPDIKWEPLEIIKSTGQTYTVIAKVSGTPLNAFFGVPPSGRKFEILSIQVHTLEKNRIKTSYQVENWLSALQQLTTQE